MGACGGERGGERAVVDRVAPRGGGAAGRGGGGGANVLWLTEWLAGAMDLRPGMRVLDLGCGRAASSIFLAREFGVQVFATDLWISASENLLRIADAGLQDRVFPVHSDARALPYAGEFFDAVISLD